MKRLQDYIQESADWIDGPVVGDDFAIAIREECLVESYIVGVVEDGIVIEADEGMMQILESYGLLEGDEYQDQIDRFLAGGGKIQQVPMKSPRKSERLGGSRHIGGMGDRPRSRFRGISANTQGTKVVGLPEEGDPYRREISPPSPEEFEEGMAEGMDGKVVFSGIGADGGKYEIVQTSPTDFMIHANGKHIDTYSSLQRAMSVLRNEVSGLKLDVEEGSQDLRRIQELAGLPLATQAPAAMPAVNEDPTDLDQEIDYDSLVVDGIDSRDYPDFSDAYFASGEYQDGTPLPDEVLDKLSNDGMLLRHYLDQKIYEAEYQGRKVALGKPFLTPDGPKKRSVYVKNPKGNVVKVNFGDKKLRIKKSNPKRRKSFRARHNCASPGPRHKARYWSCRAW